MDSNPNGLRRVNMRNVDMTSYDNFIREKEAQEIYKWWHLAVLEKFGIDMNEKLNYPYTVGSEGNSLTIFKDYAILND